jgi:hypothetical protein
MRAAAVAVILLASACSGEDARDSNQIIVLTKTAPVPTSANGDLAISHDVEIVDLADFRDLDESPVSREQTPLGPCSMILPSAIQRFADEFLACSTCYTLLCEGDLFAHVCTHLCEATFDPEDADSAGRVH